MGILELYHKTLSNVLMVAVSVNDSCTVGDKGG